MFLYTHTHTFTHKHIRGYTVQTRKIEEDETSAAAVSGCSRRGCTYHITYTRTPAVLRCPVQQSAPVIPLFRYIGISNTRHYIIIIVGPLYYNIYTSVGLPVVYYVKGFTQTRCMHRWYVQVYSIFENFFFLNNGG